MRKYLIYSICWGVKEPVGIVVARICHHAKERALRNEWEYSVQRRVEWINDKKPVVVLASRASERDYWYVVDACRRRRLATPVDYRPPRWLVMDSLQRTPGQNPSALPIGRRGGFLFPPRSS